MCENVGMFILPVRHFRQIRLEVPRVIYVVVGKAPRYDVSDGWKVKIPLTLSWGFFHCQQNFDHVKIGDPELWQLTILAAKEWHVSFKQLESFHKASSGTQICKRCYASSEDQKTFHLLKTSSHRALQSLGTLPAQVSQTSILEPLSDYSKQSADGMKRSHSDNDISKMLAVLPFDFLRLGVNCLIKSNDYSAKPETVLDL